jgi:chorismate synthase
MVAVATENGGIVIRDIASSFEMREVEELQKEVWGIPDLDVVPLTHLVASKAAGGVLVGAFDRGTLIGFVYGFPSFEHGQLAHHSHMLAVKPAYRNLDLGYRLKLVQRERVLKHGATLITWTFDPLQSLNAYFNLNKLGAFADRYLNDFYGQDAASFLHRTGTDRLWVTWPITSSRANHRNGASFELEIERPVPLVQVTAEGIPSQNPRRAALMHDHASIEIPTDINELQKRSPEVAAEWRKATRWAFTEAFASGYRAVGFSRHQKDDQDVGVYELSKE